MLIYMITHNDLSVSEGPVTHFTEIATNFEKLGHKVVAFVPDLHGLRKKWSFSIKYLSPFIRRRGIEQILYEFRLFFSLFNQCRKKRPDVIYSRQSYITLAAPFVASLLKIPLVTEINGVLADDLNARNVSALRKKINAFCEKYAYKKSVINIGVSEIVCQKSSRCYDIPIEKFTPLQNGVNTEHFQPQSKETRLKYREKFGLKKNDFCIGYVGCFTPFDGIEQLPELVAKLKEKNVGVTCVLIGQEKKKTLVEDLINKFNVEDSFVLTGRIDYDLLPEHMSAFDVGIAPYVLTSNQQIGNSSLKCLEYSSMGLPVLSTCLPQSEYITKHDCGWLVQPEDEQALALKIQEIVNIPPEKMITTGQKGREFVVANRSWERVAQSTVALLKKHADSISNN